MTSKAEIDTKALLLSVTSIKTAHQASTEEYWQLLSGLGVFIQLLIQFDATSLLIESISSCVR